MRADRLLSLLLLLQTRGKMTASELANRLEVSERTIYRDIDALSAAGVPVFGECGREGGYDLLDSYKTSLTGMTDGELRALFMLNLSKPLDELGVGQEYRKAMLKLTATLSQSQRGVEERVRQRFYLDSSWWDVEVVAVPHLQTVYQAVLQDRRIHLHLRLWFNVEIDLLVEPLGLVAKAGIWYLVCSSESHMRVQRVSELMQVQFTEQIFTRPTSFDLADWWQKWCAQRDRLRQAYSVTARVAPGFLPYLSQYTGASLGGSFSQAGAIDPHGWITCELHFETMEEARQRLLSCGGGVEVLAPRALRRSILDFIQQTMVLYNSSPQVVPNPDEDLNA